MLFLPAASGNGTQSNNPSSSEASDESVASDSPGDRLPPVEGETIEIVPVVTVSPGDRLPPVEGETIEIVPADTVSASSIASVSSTYLNGFLVGNQFNQTSRQCTMFTLPTDIDDWDGGRIRLIMQHETAPNDEIRVIDYVIAMEAPGVWGSNDNNGGHTGWARTGSNGDHRFILGDGVRNIIADPWGWATVTDYNPVNNVIATGDDLWFCSHPYVTTRFIFYSE